MRVLVFCPNWVGDAVMATPALRALSKLYPDARFTGLMRPVIAETLAGNPWLQDVLIHDHRSSDPNRRTYGVIRQMRKRRYDLAVLMTNSIRSALMAWLGGAKRRTGYARDFRGWLLNDRLKVPSSWGRYQPSPVLDYYLDLAYHLGAEPESPKMELFTDREDEAGADLLWEKWHIRPEDRVVVLNPGAAFGSAKRWPSRSFAELARSLVDEYRVRVVVLCGPSERGFARFIADAAMRPRFVHSLAEENVSIGLSKAIVRRSHLLVSTDSGPRHFGAAFGIPVVSLFGPTHIEWTDTHHALETHLQVKLPCGPCQQRTCPLGHLKCMNDLKVETVYGAASHWLGTISGLPSSSSAA